MSKKTIPLVSVIIPMYNSEKYISQTLESLSYQTMKDFEVVVVDDCSTDNSVKVVESFNRRGGGVRFNLIKLPKNSGAPGLPRNVGIQLARGKYIAFLDSDDLFTKTALEEKVTLAEKFKVDVVNTTEFFYFPDENFKTTSTSELLNINHTIISCRNANSPPLQKPIDKPNDFDERIKLWINNDFHWATCSIFCRRDFLIINQITFPKMGIGEDQIFNFACLCFAKKLLRIPNITYIVRQRMDSVSHKTVDLEEYFHKWLGNLKLGFNEFNKVMNRIDFFGEHPDYRYAVLDWFFERMLRDAWQLQTAYSQIHPAALNQFVQKEFHSDDAAFSSYLFDMVNIYRLRNMQLQQELNKFHRQ